MTEDVNLSMTGMAAVEYTVIPAQLFAESPVNNDSIEPDNSSLVAHTNPPYFCWVYDFAIEGVAMGALCLFGYVGNILSMICLSKDKSKTATPFLLVSLEIADTLFLLTVLFLRVLTSFGTFFQWKDLGVLFPYLAKYIYPMAMVFETATIYLTLLVTLNRFISVCLPYQANNLCSVQNARKQVILVWVFCWLYNIPRFFEYEIKTIEVSNTTTRAGIPSRLARNEAYQIVYTSVLYAVVMFVVPLSVLCVLNARLIAALRRATAKRKQLLTSEHSGRSEDDITRVLIVVVLVFVLSQAPALVTHLLAYALPDSARRCPHAFFFYERISDLCIVANSSINFIIYCFCSRRFRHILASTVCRSVATPEISHTNGHSLARTGSPNMRTRYTSVPECTNTKL